MGKDATEKKERAFDVGNVSSEATKVAVAKRRASLTQRRARVSATEAIPH